ncbi:MAG TPA: hypothetical protein VHH09_01325 [Acidimicrobiales bacterium]|nr:hypothetical protein [Acidimicrobiales bacterium]
MTRPEEADPTVPVEPTADLPSASPPAPPSPSAPSTRAADDWPLVGLATVLVVAGVAAASAVYGVALALTASGRASAVGPGAGLGSLLSFSWLGAAVRASTTGTDRVLAFETRFLPLAGVLVPAAVTWATLRYCRPRLRRPDALVAFLAKVAVAVALVVAVLARVVSTGDPEGPGLAARVDAGPAALFALLVVGFTGAAFVARTGPVRPERSRGPVSSGSRSLPALAPAVLAGVRAWALAVVFMTSLTLTAAVVAADSASERALLLLATPLVGLNLGVQAMSVAMGASVRLTAVGPAEVGGIPPGGAGHLSLLHFGFPPDDGAGAAPAVAFVLLALAPALVAWSLGRELRRRPAAEEQDALAAAFACAAGFSAAALAGAVASAVWLSAIASDLARPGGMLVARPSVVGTLGLAVVWGLLGALGAALLLSRRRGPRDRDGPAVA